MRLQLVLLICVCLAALSVARKGKKKHKGNNKLSKEREIRCAVAFRLCMSLSTSMSSMGVCHRHFRACRMHGKGGKKHGGGPKTRSERRFCHCFKKLFDYIKKHHNKKSNDSGVQKLTIHEKGFDIVQSAVEGNPENPIFFNGKKTELENMKACLRKFFCHPRDKCHKKKGGKRHGKKSKRKNRGAAFLFGKLRKNKRIGRWKKEKKVPFHICVSVTKECKKIAGGGRKQMKACAKEFFKCIQGKCK